MTNRILFADDDKLLLNYLVNDISANHSDKFEIIGVAENGIELLDQWKKLSPDIIITDLNMPLLGGRTAINRIRESDDKVIIIVLTQVDAIGEIELLYNKVESFLIKQKETPRQLIEKLIEIANYKSPHFERYILDIFNFNKKSKSPKYMHMDLIAYLKAGFTNEQISEKKFITVKSVEKQLQKLYKYYSVKNRIQLLKKLSE